MRVIEICLGSSCFARGGCRHPGIVAAWLADRHLDAVVRGRRCGNTCAAGPMVVIDGAAHRVADEAGLRQLLEATAVPHA